MRHEFDVGEAERLFVGPGEIRSFMRSLDSSSTSVGPVARWPHALKSTIRILLASQYPMVLTCGPEFTQLYNNAYAKLIGSGHP